MPVPAKLSNFTGTSAIKTWTVHVLICWGSIPSGIAGFVAGKSVAYENHALLDMLNIICL